MSYRLLFLLLGSITLIYAETSSVYNRVKERLDSSAQQFETKIFKKVPNATSYLNNVLINNSPSIIHVNDQLTRVIRQWNTRLLALDPTCPYYFSKYNDISVPELDRNLLSYLQAVESNETLDHPFVSVLPQSYRNALPLLSIFRCSEFLHEISTPFFHNVELIVGPGQTELPIERQSNMFSQLYCSLSGSPQVILINQTKQPEITYNPETLLSEESLADVEYSTTNLETGDCLFVPSDWVIGAQLNNSIALVYTLKNLEKPIVNENESQKLPCTRTGSKSLEVIDFAIADTFNVSEIGLIVYFYQYLNPPIFDKEFTNETFLQNFQQDRNVSQLVMKWTPALKTLVKTALFNQLDINKDGIFNVNDYFEIKQLHLGELQTAILNVLEELRQSVLAQYNELSETINRMAEQMKSLATDENAEDKVLDMINNLPEAVKERLRENNINTQEILMKSKGKKSRRPSKDKTQRTENTREDDASILFDKIQNEEDLSIITNEEQVEEITAEPIVNEKEYERTDL